MNHTTQNKGKFYIQTKLQEEKNSNSI